MQQSPRSKPVLRPSGSFVWTNCPGAPEAQEGLPDNAGAAAHWGTVAHALLSRCISSGELSADDYLGVDPKYFEPADNRYDFDLAAIKVDADMVRCVDDVLDFVWLLTENDTEIEVERRVFSHEVDPTCEGTADCILFNPATGELHVVDLKTGFKPVHADDNTQLQIYALGAVNRYRSRGVKQVHVHIVQPRVPIEGSTVRSVTYSRFELFEAVADLEAAAAATRAPDAPRKAGPWCRGGFCKAAGTCPAFEAEAMKAAQDDFGAVIADPTRLFSAKLGEKLRQARLLKDWIKSLEDHAEAEAKAGRMPGGFKYVVGQGHRKWRGLSDETKQGILGELSAKLAMPRDALMTWAPLSPAQVEKVAGKKRFASVAGLVERPETAPQLAPLDDKRPEYNPAGGFKALF